MARVFALADLHLSLSGDKPMDVFGQAWRDHPRRMAEAWDARVGEDDTVLLPGDLSWARTPEQARADLEWIGSRPGRKLLLKGNHDSWWTTASKARRLLPGRCDLLHNDSHEVGRWVVVGSRGWLDPRDPLATQADAKLFRRGLERLRRSIVHADERFGRGRPRLAMVHFPPWLVDRSPTEVVSTLESAGVAVCVYGHLHGDDHRLAVTGRHRGIRFVLAAADAVGFAPLEVIADDREAA